MLLRSLNRRDATTARLIGVALTAWSVISCRQPPALHGRGLVVLLLLTTMVAAWLVWTFWSSRVKRLTPDLYLMALAGAVLTAAAPSGASSVATFIAVLSTAVRTNVKPAFGLVGGSVIALAIGEIMYHGNALGLTAYAAGWCAMALAGTNIRQMEARAEQAELLLVQTQRSHEEKLRSTRLEEQARIARDIHDVLAHSLAGLSIQLEATTALLDQGADPESIRERVDRAHQLAREGLRETRRAVGALRGDMPAAAGLAIKALVDEYRAGADTPVEFALNGDQELLDGPAGEAVLRVVQEALTNVRKHAAVAEVTVSIDAGPDQIVALVADRQAVPVVAGPRDALHASGGGYGLRGMRERAELLAGTLAAGPTESGWRVELRLPVQERT